MAAMGIRGKLLELLEDGRDIHQLVADMIGCTRQEAKVCNYGCPGGLGRKKFGLYMRGFGVDVTDDEAATLREKWFKLFPDIRQWMDLHEVDPWKFKPDHLEPAEWLRELGFDPENETWPSRFKLLRTLHDGAIYTVMLPSGRVVPQRRYSAALNFQFQGPGADIITCAFIKVVEAGLEPFAVVHDSLNVVASEVDADQVGQKLVRCMQAAQKACCPLAPAPLPKYEVSEHML